MAYYYNKAFNNQPAVTKPVRKFIEYQEYLPDCIDVELHSYIEDSQSDRLQGFKQFRHEDDNNKLDNWFNKRDVFIVKKNGLRAYCLTKFHGDNNDRNRDYSLFIQFLKSVSNAGERR